MRMRTALGILATLMAPVASAPAWAGDCAQGATQNGLDQCAGQDFATADAALNATYRQVMARLKGPDLASTAAALVAAQRAWIAFRDAECDFTSSVTQGGSIHPMQVSNCQARLTTARTRTLAAELHCRDGDLDCPVPGP